MTAQPTTAFPQPGRPNKIGSVLTMPSAPGEAEPLSGAANALKSAASAQRKTQLGA